LFSRPRPNAEVIRLLQAQCDADGGRADTDHAALVA